MIRRFARTVLLLIRIDARRPASWVAALAAAAAQGALTAVGVPDHGGTAQTCAAIAGGFSCAAAIGAAAVGMPGAAAGRGATWCARAAWPIAGAACAAILAATSGAGWHGDLLVAIVAGALAEAAVSLVAARRGATAADAASLGLVLVTTSGVAAVSLMPGLDRFAPWTAAACFAAMALAAWAAARGRDGEPAPATDVAWFGSVLASTGLRRSLTVGAMLGSLAGMSAWFFLAPVSAAIYPIVAAGCFACLAVPQATLGPAPAADAWDVLAQCAPVAGTRRADAARWAWLSVSMHAAILGWPAVVAGLLGGLPAGQAGHGFSPLAAVAAVALSAAVVVAVVAAAAKFGASRESGFAVAAALVVACVLAIAWCLPGLPGLPSNPP